MFKYFLLLFITIPLLELYVLIELGRGIGGFATILVCLLTAAVGGLLIRLQGILTLVDAQRRLAKGELPATHVFHGLMLGASGLLLFIPGLITDTLGFLLLIPPIREIIATRLIKSITASQTAGVRRQKGDVIEGEVVAETPSPCNRITGD